MGTKLGCDGRTGGSNAESEGRHLSQISQLVQLKHLDICLRTRAFSMVHSTGSVPVETTKTIHLSSWRLLAFYGELLDLQSDTAFFP